MTSTNKQASQLEDDNTESRKESERKNKCGKVQEENKQLHKQFKESQEFHCKMKTHEQKKEELFQSTQTGFNKENYEQGKMPCLTVRNMSI